MGGFGHTHGPALESNILNFWNPVAQLHIQIYHIPKLQNNPPSSYSYVQNFGGKKKKW